MVSQAGCEIMKSEVRGSILASIHRKSPLFPLLADSCRLGKYSPGAAPTVSSTTEENNIDDVAVCLSRAPWHATRYTITAEHKQ